MKSVFNTCFLFFHFDFSRCTYLDHSNTTCQLRNALLELLAIIVRRGILDLNTNLAHATLNRISITRAVDERRVVFVHSDALGITEVLKTCALEIETNFFRNHRTAGQDSNVLEHRLTTIAKPWCFTCGYFNNAAHVVNNQCRQCFAFNVFRNNHQRARCLSYLLKHREKLSNVRDLLINQQHEGVFDFS